MRLILLILLFVVSFLAAEAQQSSTTEVTVSLTPQYQHQILSLQDTVFHAPMDDISIETLRFYISGLEFFYNGTSVHKENTRYHLIDAADTSSYVLTFSCPTDIKVDELRFLFGVDSVTSTSGVFGGDLDPINGMYWAWNSGYINFKIEGKSSQCPTRGQAYQFHLGGYAPPFASAQAVSLSISSLDDLTIAFDISNFFDQIDLSNEHTIMSPSKKAVDFSSLISKSFYIDE